MAATGTGFGLRTARRRPQPVEQRQLRVPVRLPGPVELEVLVGEVREDRHVVGDARHPIERETVRCRLHDRHVVAGVDHRAQRRLQLRRFRGRGVRLVILGPATDPGRDRADHPGTSPGRLQGRDREVGRGRLAIGAGDPDDGEVMRRIAEPPRGRTGEGRPRRVDDELRDGQLGEWPLDDEGGRTLADRGGGEVVSVGVLAWHGHEQRARDHRPRIAGHARDAHVGQRGAARGAAVDARPVQPPLGAEPRDQLRDRTRGIQVRQRAVRGGTGHRPTSLAARAASRPRAYRHGRITRSCAPVISTHTAPNERLCSYSPAIGSPLPGSV